MGFGVDVSGDSREHAAHEEKVPGPRCLEKLWVFLRETLCTFWRSAVGFWVQVKYGWSRRPVNTLMVLDWGHRPIPKGDKKGTDSGRSEKYHCHQLLYKNRSLMRGARVVQAVGRLTSAQVTISQFVGASPASGSVLSAQIPCPLPHSLCPLSAPPPLSLSLPLKNK